MNKSKRQLDIDQLVNKETKKLRKIIDDDNQSITCIETLSNEVFFEIFEYLDGYDILNAFSNLNSRFQNLLNSSALLFKIKLRSKSELLLEHQRKHIIPNQHRIIALNIIDDKPNDLPYKLFTISALFCRLESLVLCNTPTDKFESILIGLSHLPRLFSLIIYHQNVSRNFNDIYSLILGLPYLKYCRLSLNSNRKLSLPLSNNIQSTSIHHLVFYEYWLLKELCALLSYTPRLNRLVCKKLSSHLEYINTKTLIVLPNLTHISIGTCNMKFENFEIFIRNISSQLQVLRIATNKDLAYLDADRWERLISTYIPCLRIFDFQYKESIDDLNITSYHMLINQFNSLFWIQRQWFLEIRIDEWKLYEGSICYSISPLRKRWYQFSDHWTNQRLSSEKLIPYDITSNRQDLISDTVQLSLMDLSFVNCIELFMNFINPVLNLVQITRLSIDHKISIDILSEFIRSLPNLTSLIIWRLSSWNKRFKSVEQEYPVNLKLNYNKILKICLKKLTELDQVESLIDLCPSMEYLELIDIKRIDLLSLLQLILRKHGKNILYHLTLCLKNDQVEDKIIQSLDKMINAEKQNFSLRALYPSTVLLIN